MTDYRPNPLVTALAKKLVHVTKADESGAVSQVAIGVAAPDASAEDVANALASDSAVPELVTLAGFLGGSFAGLNDDRKWRVFYLDPKLLTWLVISEDDIVLHRQVTDVATPTSGREAPIVRDLIWLKSSASVTEGTGPPRAHEIEAQFLRGDFVGAGDFSASVAGGTFSRATGLLCEVQTPGCCGRRTR